MAQTDTGTTFSHEGSAAYPLQKQEHDTKNLKLLQQIKAKGNQPERFERLQRSAHKFADLIQDTCPNNDTRDALLTKLVEVVIGAYACITDEENKI